MLPVNISDIEHLFFFLDYCMVMQIIACNLIIQGVNFLEILSVAKFVLFTTVIKQPQEFCLAPLHKVRRAIVFISVVCVTIPIPITLVV